MLLSDLSIKKARIQEKEYTLKDGAGLFLNIHPNGSKYWLFRFSWNQKQTRLCLGTYPDLGLKEARSLREEKREMIANGIDPRLKPVIIQTPEGKKTVIKSERPTLEAFIPEWQTLKYKKLGKVDPNRRNSTQSQIERYLKKDILPILGKIPLDQITRLDVLKVLRKMEKRGAFTPAEKVRSWLKEIFKHAFVLGHIEFNPATDMEVVALPKPPVVNNPHLEIDELPQFFNALKQYQGERQTMLGVKLLFLTGVRPGELRFAKLEQFNLEEALWTIPVMEVKQLQRQVKRGEKVPDYLVPLSKQAIDIIKELMSKQFINQQYLFKGRHRHKPISENTLNQAIKRIGYSGRLTSHGIRGTLSTALYEMEYEPRWIEGQLSHVDPSKVVRAYNHAQYVPQRRKMMQDWADLIDQWETEGLSR